VPGYWDGSSGLYSKEHPTNHKSNPCRENWKREGEFANLKLKLGDLDLKYKVRGEELDAAISKAKGLPTNQLNEKIAALEKELSKVLICFLIKPELI